MKKKKKLLVAGIALSVLFSTNLQAQTVNYTPFETKESLDSGIIAATNEKVIKGPKDAFTENYQSNVGLIRKRIRSKNLKINEYTIGTSSKTRVALFYLDDIVNKDLVMQ